MISASNSYVKIERIKKKVLPLLLFKRMRRLSLLILLLFFLSSCSFFKEKPQPYPSGVFFPVERDGQVVYQGKIIDLVERDGDRLYLSTSKGLVYCIDSVKRTVLWKSEVFSGLMSPPSLGAHNLYLYDENGVLYCLSKEGRLLWKKEVGENITSRVCEARDTACFGTEKGIILALEPSSGRELWRFQTQGAIRSTPVFVDGRFIFGCDDHKLYLLSDKGELIGSIKVGDKIQASPLVMEKNLYFGSDDHYFYCFNLKKLRRKWKVKTGGNIFTPAVTDGKRVLFLCFNNVLYCLNRRNGHILWWGMIPSRSYYHLEVSEGRVVVSSLSSVVAGFDIETGKRVGEFDAGQELRSNPVWLNPYLLINIYDDQKEEGRLLFLKKIIRVSLKPSKNSPLKVGEEVAFTASARGFYLPKYEFYLKKGNEKEIVQERSEKESWVWFPEKAGEYVVGVRVTDEKESASAEIPFKVENDSIL
jgi:outer membrane protein assembly factor BamB